MPQLLNIGEWSLSYSCGSRVVSKSPHSQPCASCAWRRPDKACLILILSLILRLKAHLSVVPFLHPFVHPSLRILRDAFGLASEASRATGRGTVNPMQSSHHCRATSSCTSITHVSDNGSRRPLLCGQLRDPFKGFPIPLSILN